MMYTINISYCLQLFFLLREACGDKCIPKAKTVNYKDCNGSCVRKSVFCPPKDVCEFPKFVCFGQCQPAYYRQWYQVCLSTVLHPSMTHPEELAVISSLQNKFSTDSSGLSVQFIHHF
jgi:hypothetical protein